MSETTNPETETAPHLVLDFHDGGDVGVFPAWPTMNQGVLWKYRNELTGFDAVMALTYSAVKADQTERLEEFLIAHGHADDFAQVLFDALEALVKGETNLPLERSQDSSTSTPDTEPQSTDDSLSEGTEPDFTDAVPTG